MKIEESFRQLVKKDKKVENAYLLVYSESLGLGLNLNLAEGKTGTIAANPMQASHMASVGKLFTATLTGILHDQGTLSFDEKISKYLDKELMDGLHILHGVDYSGEITIKHLLTQTSGLYDVFFKLFKRMKDDPSFQTTPRKAVIWGKENLKPVAKPGKKHHYTDTNYYLLGLIIESLLQKPFHTAIHDMILSPLGMDNTYLFGFSQPRDKPDYPAAGIFIDGFNCMSDKRFAQIDYAGGSITAPMADLLKFMKGLTSHKLLKESTLNTMIHDDISMGFPVLGFNYGYSIWKPKAIPVLMPKKYFCWGCVGITGAFMFYHPGTDAYVIGTFNDKAYTSKALRFMLTKVIKELLKQSSH